MNKAIYATAAAAAITAAVLLTQTVFAQETVEEDSITQKPFTVTLDTAWDLLYRRDVFGDYASKEPAIPGSPYKYQGEGTTRFLQNTVFDDGLNSRVQFAYSDDDFGGRLQLRASPDSSFQGAWDWEAWMRFFGFVKLHAGNLAQRGRLDQYQRFDDFLRTKVDNLGIMLASWKQTGASPGNVFTDVNFFPYGYDTTNMSLGYAEFSGSDTTDLLKPAGSASRSASLLLEADFEKLNLPPITIQAAASGILDSKPLSIPWRLDVSNNSMYDAVYDPVTVNNINMGLRAEWRNLFEMLSLSSIYKFSFSLLAKPEAVVPTNALDERITNHAFGIYANLATPLKGLELAAGYSGLLQSWENPLYTETQTTIDEEDAHYLTDYEKGKLPYYNGIDLRLSYTGIKSLALTLNNNVSFAGITGSDTTGRHSHSRSWAYEGMLNNEDQDIYPYRIEYYTGFYNALGATYSLPGGKVDVHLQAANRLGVFTLIWQEEPVRSFTNTLGLFAGAYYQINRGANIKAIFRGGLACNINSYSFQQADATRVVHKTSFVEFAIPIGMKIEFSPAIAKSSAGTTVTADVPQSNPSEEDEQLDFFESLKR